MSDVLISEFMDQGAANSLIADYDVHWDPNLWGKRAELLAQVASARAIIVRNATQVNVALLDAAPNLKIVARMGVGLDNIDVEACKSRGVEVCPSIGANAASVAEYVIATAMILLRGPAYYATPDVVGGAWDRPKFASGVELGGRTMGIVASSDVISLHCPLLPQTRNLIGAAEFARMKQGAILINSARGGIANEAACADALKSGHLGGAALDTLAVEPIDEATCALFAGIQNLILTPHIAGVTQESNRRIAEVAVDNVRRILGAAL
jgi:(S)-sulfolactate dehydrogenase